jgi:hypothetical protein
MIDKMGRVTTENTILTIRITSRIDSFPVLCITYLRINAIAKDDTYDIEQNIIIYSEEISPCIVAFKFYKF